MLKLILTIVSREMKNISSDFVDYELFKETHSYLMNIPFIKNIIEENRIEAEGF
jgi:hypothetical protein